MKIYKYRNFSQYSIDSLKSSNLYFSNPFDYNDAFEFTFDESDNQLIEKWKSKFKDNSEKSHFALASFEIEFKNRKNPDYDRVLCFSETYNNPLMWAHYSDSGKGFCLEFETETEKSLEWIGFKIKNFKDAFFNLKSREKTSYNEEGIYLLPLFKVKYMKRPPKFIDKLEEGYFKYAKDIIWSYEKEWRIVVTKDLLKTQILEYEKKYLKSIIFGLNTSDENVKMVKEIVNNNYSNPIKFFKIIKVDGTYLVDKVEI